MPFSALLTPLSLTLARFIRAIAWARAPLLVTAFSRVPLYARITLALPLPLLVDAWLVSNFRLL